MKSQGEKPVYLKVNLILNLQVNTLLQKVNKKYTKYSPFVKNSTTTASLQNAIKMNEYHKNNFYFQL